MNMDKIKIKRKMKQKIENIQRYENVLTNRD